MRHRGLLALLFVSLGLSLGLSLGAAGCTADNPDYRPGSTPSTPDGRGISDLEFPISTDLSSPDLSFPDLWMPDLFMPDMAQYSGPSGDAAEDVLSTWDVGESTDDNLQPCAPVRRGKVMLATDNMHVKSGFESVRVSYGPDASYYFQAVYPSSRNAGWNLATRFGVDFFVDGQQPQSYGGWMPPGPTIILCGANKSYRRLDPIVNQTPRMAGNWIELKVQLAGGAGWTAQDVGPFSLSKVDSIEFHFDPLRNNGTGTVTTWLDGLRFF